MTRIHSVAGTLPAGCGLIETPPFRAPHHGISAAGLVGGGTRPAPGEISLAHRGRPVSSTSCPSSGATSSRGSASRSRKRRSASCASAEHSAYPADVLLVAAMNPCPCGFAGDARRVCTWLGVQRQRYARKISGPLLDRIDLHVPVPPVPVDRRPERARPRNLRLDPGPRRPRPRDSRPPAVRPIPGFRNADFSAAGFRAPRSPRCRREAPDRHVRRSPRPVGARAAPGPARRADDRRSRRERGGSPPPTWRRRSPTASGWGPTARPGPALTGKDVSP